MNLSLELLFTCVTVLLFFGGMIAAAIWVYRDASSKKSYRPRLWACMVFFAIIPCFPLYLWKRSIDKNSGQNSIGSRALFGVSILSMSFMLPLYSIVFTISIIPFLAVNSKMQNTTGSSKTLNDSNSSKKRMQFIIIKTERYPSVKNLT